MPPPERTQIRPHASPAPRLVARRADLVSGGPRAFSLIELVVVVTIMAIVTTIGALRYGSALTRYRAEAACLRLVADLRLAQTMARSTSSRRTVRFDTTRAVYQILTDDEIAASKPGIEVSLAADPYGAQMRVDGLPGKALSFDGRGEGNQGAVVVLTVGAAEKAVILEPNFGRAYVAGSNN